MLLSACTTSLKTERIIATADEPCKTMVKIFFDDETSIHSTKVKIKDYAENGVLDALDMEKLTVQYDYFVSNQPIELTSAFAALKKGKMSFSVFQTIISEYPTNSTSVNALIFKEHLKVLHKEKPTLYPANGFELIESTFNQKHKIFTLKEEALDYYIIEVPMNGAKDISFLERLANISMIQPILFSVNSSVPTNSFFKVPSTLIEQISKNIVDKFDERHVLIYLLEEGQITLDATRALIDFNGKIPLNFDYHVSKTRLLNLSKRYPESFKGNSSDIEFAFKKIKFGSHFQKINESNDEITYQFTVNTNEDLKSLHSLMNMTIEGRISLSE
jgi:hypothetical protein